MKFRTSLAVNAIAVASGLVILILAATETRAQGKQAIVILRAQNPSSTVNGCEGSAYLNYRVLFDFKINNKDEIRIGPALGSLSQGEVVSRQAYEGASKIKMRDLAALKWGPQDKLYAMSPGSRSPIVAIPDDKKPDKNTSPQLSSLYAVAVTGEEREGKQKQKIVLQLSDVWKVYFVAEGASANESLFAHASEEKSVPLWQAYFKKTENYRKEEAYSAMRDAIILCSKADLNRFLAGDYRAFGPAREKALRAQSVRDDAVVKDLLAAIIRAKQETDSKYEHFDELLKAGKWDESIESAAESKKYLESWPELGEKYQQALKASHDLHTQMGNEALQAQKFEEAEKEYGLARSRVPGSEKALRGLCEAKTQIALRDSSELRRNHQPENAKALLEQRLKDTECEKDPRVSDELAAANCEFAQQLLAEAMQLVTVAQPGRAPRPEPVSYIQRKRPSPRRKTPTAAAPSVPVSRAVKEITAQNKSDFRQAREELLLARKLCTSEQIQALLDASEQHLSIYCLAQANTAIKRGAVATAYVYLHTALEYTPNDQTAIDELARVKEQFERQASVNVGVAFSDRSGSRDAQSVIAEITSEIESAATRAGLANMIVMDREQAAAALRDMQTRRPIESPTAIFYGELLVAATNRRDAPRNVQSAFSFSNPDWERADQYYQEARRNYDNCKKTYGEARCTSLGYQANQYRAHRDSLPRVQQRAYQFRETLSKVSGGLRMSFRYSNSISSSTQAIDNVEDSVNRECTQREGVQDNDVNGFRNTGCDLSDPQSYLSQMVSRVKTSVGAQVLERLRAFPLAYFDRARTAQNRQQAVEDYLRFFFMSTDKNDTRAEEAKEFIKSFDSELATDGVLK